MYRLAPVFSLLMACSGPNAAGPTGVEESSAAQPPGIERDPALYRVIDSIASLDGTTWAILHVEIPERLPKKRLQMLWQEIRNDHPRPRAFTCRYYLPGMTISEGPWATASASGVEIMGLTDDEEVRLREAATQGTHEVLATVVDNAGARVIVVRRTGECMEIAIADKSGRLVVHDAAAEVNMHGTLYSPVYENELLYWRSEGDRTYPTPPPPPRHRSHSCPLVYVPTGSEHAVTR